MDRSATTGTAADAVELLTVQHREIERLRSQLRNSSPAGSEHTEDLLRRAIMLLAQHDAIETQMLYPALKDTLDGTRLAEVSLEEHQHIREQLAEVDRSDDALAERLHRFAQCMLAVEAHVAEEEDQVFPMLQRQVGHEQLAELGRRMERAMSLAPTHPHPNTPSHPLGASVTGAVLGVVDKARDALRDHGS